MSAAPGAQVPPPDYSNRGPAIVGCATVLIIVPTIAVAIRLWSRVVAAAVQLWWDDWAILVTLLFSHLFLATNIWWTTLGLGQHSWMIPATEIRLNDVANHVALIWYETVISLIKISALTLYARVFNSKRSFRITLWALGALITIWWIVLLVVPWTFCHPARKTIDPLIKGTCREGSSWYLATALINALLDMVILILPMPLIWKLRINFRKKILVSVAFVFGYSSAFLSFARFIIIARRPEILGLTNADPSWDLVPVLYISMMEAPFAIIALCGPAINQLVQRTVQFGFGSLLHTKKYPTPLLDAAAQSRNPDQKFSKLHDQFKADGLSSSYNGSRSRTRHNIGNASSEENFQLGWQGSGNSAVASANPMGREHCDWSSRDIGLDSITVNTNVSVSTEGARQMV